MVKMMRKESKKILTLNQVRRSDRKNKPENISHNRKRRICKTRVNDAPRKLAKTETKEQGRPKIRDFCTKVGGNSGLFVDLSIIVRKIRHTLQ